MKRLLQFVRELRSGCFLLGHDWRDLRSLPGKWVPFMDTFVPIVGLKISMCRFCPTLRFENDMPPMPSKADQYAQHALFWQRHTSPRDRARA